MTTVPVPPPVDPRDRAELAAWTAALARRYSAWRPAPDGSPDPGSALIGVAARFAELVLARLNRAPERAHLAFLEFIGEQPVPARPARVPLTFTAAEGSTGVGVPAGTPVTASAGPGRPEDVVFETDSPLTLSPARLQRLVVSDPVHDTWTDVPVPEDGSPGELISAFVGAGPVAHELYLTHPMLVTPAPAPLTLVITTPPDEPWAGEQVRWSRWDGGAWAPVAAETGTVATASGVRTFRQRIPVLAPPEESGVEGMKAPWLRAELTVPLAGRSVAEPPTAVAVGRRPPEPPAAGLAPFGADTAVKWFYLSLPAIPAGSAGARVRVVLTAARWGRAARGRPAVLNWTYRVGETWRPLGRSWSTRASADGPARLVDSTQALTRPGDAGAVTFDLPADLGRSLLNGVEGRWVRVEVDDADGGGFEVPPLLDALEIGYERLSARVRDLLLERDTPLTAPVPVPAAMLNAAETLDLTRDVRPFGADPAYDDTVYLECPEELATAPRLTLAVSVANAAGRTTPLPTVRLAPALRWETYDGTRWSAVRAVSRADAFTTDGDVVLTPAAPLVATELDGRRAHWVRARLRGDYGRPERYDPVKATRVTKDAAGNPVTEEVWSMSYVAATLAPPVLAELSWRPYPLTSDRPRTIVTRNGDRVTVDHVAAGQAAGGSGGLVPFRPDAESDPALHLAFDDDFGGASVTLFLPVEPPLPDEVAGEGQAEPPRLAVVWEYTAPDGWRPLPVEDGTEALAGRGVVRFVGPADQSPAELFGRRAWWVRARVAGGDLPLRPRLRGVLPGTVWATQGSSVREEILGGGTGTPGQGFTTAHTPVLEGERLVVREDVSTDGTELWTDWQPVADLRVRGPEDRCFTLDRLTGAIAFGDGVAGRVPPAGEGNVRITYRYGGGEPGNAPAGEVSDLTVALPSVEAVTNHFAAEGGAERESTAQLRERGSRALRHRDRAVAASDLEDLAREATREVARARAVVPAGYDPFDLWLDPSDPRPTDAHLALDGGRAGVVVVPVGPQDRPTPSAVLLAQVRAHLLGRAPATADLWVSGPEWIGVGVVATVVPADGADPDDLRRTVARTLHDFLHPLTGGPGGRGWDFGRKPHRSDLFALVQGLPGVHHVRQLAVHAVPEVPSEAFSRRIGDLLDRPLTEVGASRDTEARRWLDRALVFSGGHDITTTLRR